MSTYFLPYQKFVIETSMKKEDVLAGVRKNVRPLGSYSIWTKKREVNSDFNGITGADGFSISVSREQVNLFEAIITADVKTTFSGTQVSLVADLPTWVSVLAGTVAVALAGMFVYNLILPAEQAQYEMIRFGGLGFLGFYVVLMFTFYRDFLFARRRLLEIFGGHIVDPHGIRNKWTSR